MFGCAVTEINGWLVNITLIDNCTVCVEGLVTLIGSLDHETRPVHHLTLIAEDSSPSLTLTSSTMLVVSVSDVDDVIPLISIEPAYSSPVDEALESPDTIKVHAVSTSSLANGLVSSLLPHEHLTKQALCKRQIGREGIKVRTKCYK